MQQLLVAPFTPRTDQAILHADDLGGEPILLGTRIRVALIYAMEAKAGMSVYDIAKAYPHLTPHQIESALEFAHANKELMEECLRRDEQEV